MILPGKPEITYLRNTDDNIQNTYAIRMVNMDGIADSDVRPSASIINNKRDGRGYFQTIMSFAYIKSMFVAFSMPQYPT
ncbi:MAG: hypothetical protein EZS28_019778 [Streblomastix strix]|uniref:Uncharacterized protein n=1 Tax=Streblomastix strix TaxID=222440 RepID=A0A5J4VQD1_9EUKA|nr:MAG: hypothetical protein EZS28_019778 [Streblomastix strix]